MTQTLRKGVAVESDLSLIYNISMRDFRPSIVGILFHPEREVQGTGFFVPDGAILTCAHVIESFYEPGRQVYFRVEGQDTVHAADVIHLSPKGGGGYRFPAAGPACGRLCGCRQRW